ncbi:MAG: hypothetical protein KAT70_04890, partial [Thermoplasmata archaeon]|nr:hypothetical protein [Thermoplasmata archaeon]
KFFHSKIERKNSHTNLVNEFATSLINHLPSESDREDYYGRLEETSSTPYGVPIQGCLIKFL